MSSDSESQVIVTSDQVLLQIQELQKQQSIQTQQTNDLIKLLEVQLGSSSSSTSKSTTESSSIYVIPFDGKNYLIWKSKVLAYFDSLGYSEVIEKSISSQIPSSRMSFGQTINVKSMEERLSSASSAKEKLLIRKSFKVYAMLILSLQGEPLRVVQHIPRGDAFGLWKCLTEKYEGATDADQVHLRSQLHKLKLKENESIDNFISRISQLVLQIESIDKDDKISEKELLVVLYDGLPITFQPVIQALKVSKEKSFTIACKHIRNYYNELSYKSTASGGAINLTSSSCDHDKVINDNNLSTSFAGLAKSKFKSNKYNYNCRTCGKPGHIAYYCEQNKDKDKCDYCRRVGHIESRCIYRHPTINNNSKSKSNREYASTAITIDETSDEEFSGYDSQVSSEGEY